MRIYMRGVILGLGLLGLAACGVKGDLKPPPGSPGSKVSNEILFPPVPTEATPASEDSDIRS